VSLPIKLKSALAQGRLLTPVLKVFSQAVLRRWCPTAALRGVALTLANETRESAIKQHAMKLIILLSIGAST
jgi:hypothetical protein